MSNILSLIEEKVSPKYLIYLQENKYELYNNINKDVSSISYETLDNNIFEVIKVNTINGEDLYLIGVDNNELGWVSIKSPILILNSFSDFVSPLEDIIESSLNKVLEIHSTVKSNELYAAKYISSYENEIYVGIENNIEFLGFFPISLMNFGNINNISFKFNNSIANVYLTHELNNSQTIISDELEYVTNKYFEDAGIGIVQIGKKEYWFKGNETNIDHKKIKLVEKDYEEYYLEHLIKSIQIDKGLKTQDQQSTGTVNKEYVESLQERTIQLKEKNVEHLENNRKLNKELQDERLELKRKISKIDYLERLTDNQNNKINYYEERNKKLEDRVQLLEEKLENINSKYKELRSSKLVRMQSKFLGK